MLTECVCLCVFLLSPNRKSTMCWKELRTDCAQTTPLPRWAKLTSGRSVCAGGFLCIYGIDIQSMVYVCPSGSRRITLQLGTGQCWRLGLTLQSLFDSLTLWIKQSHGSVCQPVCVCVFVSGCVPVHGGWALIYMCWNRGEFWKGVGGKFLHPFHSTQWVLFILIIGKVVCTTTRQLIWWADFIRRVESPLP